MNNKIIVIAVLALVLIGGFLIYRNRSGVKMDNTYNPVTATQNTNDQAVPVVTPNTQTTTSLPAIKEFTVTGSSFMFAPKSMTVSKGDTVKITFINSGGFHDFVLEAFGIRTPRLNAGQSAVVTFVADKVGSYEYYCSVGNHRAQGMVGTLKVI